MKLHKADRNKKGIYAIINTVNNKRYIGKSINILSRIQHHTYALRKNNSNSENQHLINAWNKYGEENFIYEILEIIETFDEKVFYERELHWMDFYNSTDREFGYNLRRDSSTKMIVHPETIAKYKKKIGKKNPNFNNKWSDAKKLYMSNLKKQQYKNGVVKVNLEGIKKGNITRLNKLQSDSLYREQLSKNVSLAKTKYKIEQYSKNGELIYTWNNMISIIEANPNYKKHNIYAVCSGEKPSMYGYVWKKILSNDIVRL